MIVYAVVDDAGRFVNPPSRGHVRFGDMAVTAESAYHRQRGRGCRE